MGGGNEAWVLAEVGEEKEMSPILRGPQIGFGGEGGEDPPPPPLLRTGSLDTPIPLTTGPGASGAGEDVPGEVGVHGPRGGEVHPGGVLVWAGLSQEVWEGCRAEEGR